jgi:hypothetical protein
MYQYTVVGGTPKDLEIDIVKLDAKQADVILNHIAMKHCLNRVELEAMCSTREGLVIACDLLEGSGPDTEANILRQTKFEKDDVDWVVSEMPVGEKKYYARIEKGSEKEICKLALLMAFNRFNEIVK